MDGISDLYTVELVQGLRLKSLHAGGTSAVYKTVFLRESCEKYLHDAIRQVQEMKRGPDGRMHLVHNEALYEAARIAQHIDHFSGNGPDLLASDIDLAVLGQLHPLDVALIADRLLHIELAAQLRWGLITQDEYDLILLGKSSASKKPLTPAESLQALKKVIDSIARVTHTSLDTLQVMPLAELEATLKNLASTPES
jgi:hypothetical protein